MVANNNGKTTSKKEVAISIFFAFLFMGLVMALVVANFRINGRRDEMIKRIDQLKTDIKTLEEKNQQLNKSLNQVDTDANLEKVAREQLGLKKPGEEVVVINNLDKVAENNVEKPVEVPKTKPNRSIWNPLDWWGLLTGK